jgi:hypothetical protein
MDKKRLEWLYRLGRQLAIPQFVWLVVKERLRRGQRPRRDAANAVEGLSASDSADRRVSAPEAATSARASPGSTNVCGF